MRRLIAGLLRPSTILPATILMFIAWVVLSRIIPQNQLAIITNATFISVALAVNAAYGPVLIKCLRAPDMRADQYLVSGILLIFLSIAASRVWSMAIILANKPDWMINAPVQSLCYLMAALSGFFFLKVPGRTAIGWRYTTMAGIFAVMIVSLWLVYVEGGQ